MRTGLGYVLALTIGLATPASATDDDLRTVSGMVNHNSVLLVFAPSLADPRLAQQRRSFAKIGAAAASGDLLLVQVAENAVIGAHDKPEKLREHFNVPGDAYRAFLISRDGHVVAEQAGPIEEGQLTQVIGAPPAAH